MTSRVSSCLVRNCIAGAAWLVLVVGGWAVPLEDSAPYHVEQVEGLDTKAPLHAVRAIDAKTCIIVGDKGFMARSTDGGKKWELINSRTTATLRDVRFVTPQLGLAVGHGGDYGVPLFKKEFDLRDLANRAKATSHVVNNGQCWSTILRTDNGGKSWLRHELSTNLPMYRVLWLDRRRAVAASGYYSDNANEVGQANDKKSVAVSVGGVSDGTLFTTQDGGRNWKMLYNLGSPCRALALSSDNTGWVVGPTGERPARQFFNGREVFSLKDLTPREKLGFPADFKRSLEVPLTWNASSVNLGVFDRERVNAMSYTVNETEGVGKAPNLWDVCIQGNQVFVAGDDALLATAERKGKKWQSWKVVELPEAPKVALRAMAFRDAKTGLLVGEKGVCYATMNGGKTWKRVDTKTPETLNGIQFMGTSAVVVGSNGTAFRLVPQK